MGTTSSARGAPRTFRVSRAATIAAPADRLYGIIADYRAGHPRILPEPYFSNLVVDEGGVGAGTRFHFDARAFGRVETVHGVAEEPAPGRELVERYPATGVVTTFTVEPRGDGATEVTITTLMPRKPGLGGLLEQWTMPVLLGRLFADELGRLARVAGAGS